MRRKGANKSKYYALGAKHLIWSIVEVSVNDCLEYWKKWKKNGWAKENGKKVRYRKSSRARREKGDYEEAYNFIDSLENQYIIKAYVDRKVAEIKRNGKMTKENRLEKPQTNSYIEKWMKYERRV
jgi:hypothetical protein